MDLNTTLPILLLLAWLLPLGSFALILLFGPWMGKAGRGAGLLATGAILASFVLSAIALGGWVSHYPPQPPQHAEATHAEETDAAASHHAAEADQPQAIAGDWYSLGEFGALKTSIGYYIDSLTLAMFCMVTLVASCIHVYSMGYMHEELEEVTDPLVTLPNGEPLRRRGRFHRFFQYMSLFCFSMLGLVVAGNLLMVFVFWELVGICSYLLIGFYHERKSASNAANKAFIVNRVGDFGMIIGLMALWAGLGTFAFEDIFSQVRPAAGGHALTLPGTMDGYWLLVVAGLGIFCGCVGKSAQFPLHVWLPDAMEGPTPVSALIHAATMVAAGVYLVGRFYPVFTPEVLLVIAYVGCITLFIAATIAITATDIKRVLAYSTVSQLGYMMFGLGVGGWVAGLFHLFTHACFKALLFLCSGSVIHACHTNEMPEMGGLRKKMPWTAWTMMAGCLAISGAGIPLLIGLSGYYSKDSILAQAFSFNQQTPAHGWMFWVAALGAAITALYMFRLWFMTFAGEPRNPHVYEHAHESPKVMYVPLVILAVLAVVAGWRVPLTGVGLVDLLEQARPAGTAAGIFGGAEMPQVIMPAEHLSHAHEIHVPVSLIAFGTALAGFLVAVLFYGLRAADPERVRSAFSPVHWFLRNKWFFDELYRFLFVRPVLGISGFVAAVDKKGIDWLADNSARAVAAVSSFDDWIDRVFVDRLVDLIAGWTYATGLKLRRIQTGNLRQYVMLIVVGTVALFVLITLCFNYAGAGP